MFSNIVKNLKLNLAKSISAGSIKARLTLFYSVTMALLMIVSISFLYFMTLHIMHNANQQFLSDEIDVLKNLLENKPDRLLALKQEIDEVPYTKTPSEYHYYIRIMDKKNNVLLETPHFNNLVRDAALFKQPATPKKISGWWYAPDGNPYILMQASGHFGKAKESVIIQVALDISCQQDIINKYTKLLIILLILILLTAVFLGFYVANKGMQSLYRLTEATTKITASSLHQRIDPKSWPKELNKLGMAFNQMLERLETAVLHLTQFAGDLAHELRTPVNNLMGETEIALAKAHSSEEYRQVLESNLEELQRIAHIIENLLFLARAENPKLALKKEIVHVADEITLICDFYQAVADEKEIRVTQEGDATLSVNPIMFRRALSNLLSNALKYTPQKGFIHFSVKKLNSVIEIIITDNGIGIAAHHLANIFQRFYRVDSARARSDGGTGLGLAIVKSIVDLHHGIISIDSELGKGTTVRIILPKKNILE